MVRMSKRRPRAFAEQQVIANLERDLAPPSRPPPASGGRRCGDYNVRDRMSAVTVDATKRGDPFIDHRDKSSNSSDEKTLKRAGDVGAVSIGKRPPTACGGRDGVGGARSRSRFAITSTVASRDTQHPLVPVVRERLHSLGNFAHLTVYRAGDHLFVAHPGPPDAPHDVDPVLRISHAGRWRFGLSLRRPSGRWQPVPIAGAMFQVIAEAVRTFEPWLVPRPVFSETMETDY